ncbi:MAG: 2-succinyl-6-hydroxy-2,4-cyclohexadiene-1-carboxylate synthase [Chloroflexota bacterium]|nr:2-succinyl-6-hydroxy-2,4-cyclohexadiene-1-carboxylate synthase [Chloroflexota bacterium]
MAFVSVGNVRYHIEERGDGKPLVLLHGFTGSSESWRPIFDDLVGDYHVIAIDAIGHGSTAAPPDPLRYAFNRALDDLGAIMTHLAIERAAWLGYSMGGRLALSLALRQPQRIDALILESASPGIADDTQRAARRCDDKALAHRIENDGVEAFVNDWERHPMWESQRSLTDGVLQHQRELRLRNYPAGLANSLRGMGQGAQPSFWTRLHEIHVPTLLIAGALDHKFAGIAARMHVDIPASVLNVVPDAGHAVHLERPHQFVEAVRAFLTRHDNRVGSSREINQ